MKRDQRGRGRFLGGKRPVGYRIGLDGALVEETREQAALTQARGLRAQGSSLRKFGPVSAEQRVAISRATLHRALGGAGRRVAHLAWRAAARGGAAVSTLAERP